MCGCSADDAEVVPPGKCRPPQAETTRLGDGDALGGDGAGELDVFSPVDGKDVGAAGFFAVSADDIHSASAGAKCLHEARIV